MTDDAVRAALAASREELLDLGLRNPLLDLRPGGRRLVQVTDERALEVYRLLVTEGRRMDFLPAPEVDDAPAPDALDQPADDGRVPARHLDRHLQTVHGSVVLQKRLHALALDARTVLEEQGVNALSLALGVLHWREGPDAPERRAPLVMVPVELARTSARARFTLGHTGEDAGANLSLVARLRADLGVSLDVGEGEEGLDPAAFVESVAALAAGREGWWVEPDAIALGLFSFGRFLLYHDLDEAAWPADRKPSAHPVVRALLGEGFGAAPPPAEAAEDALEVVDADASQAAALAEVAAGRHLVIQGPPGTGKSQTIANLIAQAVGAGKRVLFVAEKMAALEVVKRRLDQIGLGDLCLELHSHKSQKKAVLAELKRTLGLGVPAAADGAAERRELAEVRGRLDAYREALMAPVGASGVAPFDALGALQAVPDQHDLPRIPFTPLAGWDRATFAGALARADELQVKVAALGSPAAHPFHGCVRTTLLPVDAEALGDLLATALEAQARLARAGEALAERLGLAAPRDAGALTTALEAARVVESAPDLEGVDVRSPAWRERDAEVGRALALVGEVHAQVRAQPDLLPEAWGDDLLATPAQIIEARQDLARLGGRWWRFFAPRYWRARRKLALLSRERPSSRVDLALAAFDALLAVRRRRNDLKAVEPLAASLFRTRWVGWDGDPAPLEPVHAWLRDVHARVAEGALPAALLERSALPDRDVVRTARAEAEDARAAATAALRAVTDFLEHPPLDADFDARRATLERWTGHAGALRGWCAWAQLAATARAEGLGDLVDLAARWPAADRRLTDVLTVSWYGGLLATAEAQRPALSGFDADRHGVALERFRALDRSSFALNRARLAAWHHAQLPGLAGDVGAMGLLRREMEKKTRHLPIRRLLVEAGEAVQRLKPVFMMGPLSVATYLAPEGPRFDLVVFDEASQVRPVEALGAIARGEQVVVVGDSRQLPPTRFFERLLDSGDLADDAPNVTADLESVLGLFAAAGAPTRMLTWHYRSRHPSLIAVSNHLFYGDALTLFPSPVRTVERSDDLGLALRHLPDARYDRGGTRTNPVEAAAIADAVMQHAREQPDRTLGVVAFSSAQTEAIVEALEHRRREEADCERFFNAHPHEPFFVKNLENVQGDERDVVLISVGYGRAADGRVYANFGPLNLEGGERRLNVLITRARRRCVVFTHLHPDDVPDTPAAGVRALRTFLRYARDGHLGSPVESGGPVPGFVEAVRQALEAEGYAAHARVGTAGFHVDLAIVDPEDPDRYALGVEIDGALYAGSETARERDRLRQAVLEGLGWRLHRVWSLEWQRDHAGALGRLRRALAEAPGASLEAEETPGLPATDTDWGYTRAPAARSMEALTLPAAPPYEAYASPIDLGGKRLQDLRRERVVRLVVDVVAVEAPLWGGLVARRICDNSALHRPGTRMLEAVKQAVDDAVQKKLVDRRDGFLWRRGQSAVKVRDRSARPRNERRPRVIAPEERRAALEQVLSAASAASVDAVIVEANRRVGLPRHEAEETYARAVWLGSLDEIVESGEAERTGDTLRWVGPGG